MPDLKVGYASYLLCLWIGNEAGKPVWRASLESTRDTERYSFPSVEELLEFLKDQFIEPKFNGQQEIDPFSTPYREEDLPC
jgi:hypothetical protein